MKLSQRRQRFFQEQYRFGKDYLASFLSISPNQFQGMRVLEVGGGEFGLLKALYDYGANCSGIDISEDRVNYARQLHQDLAITFHIGDICDYQSIAKNLEPFDLIVLRDVIEHIPRHDLALKVCSKLLKPGGLLYISFPPIHSPFGGHQQNFKFGKVLPYIHLLPNSLYRFILRKLGAKSFFMDTLLATKSTGITIKQISNIIKKLPLQYVFKKCYLVRPDYEIRFNLKKRSCLLLNSIPLIREIFSTGCLMTLKKVKA